MSKYQPNYKSGPHATGIARRLLAASAAKGASDFIRRASIVDETLTEPIVERVEDGVTTYLVRSTNLHFTHRYYFVWWSEEAGRFVCSLKDDDGGWKYVKLVERYIAARQTEEAVEVVVSEPVVVEAAPVNDAQKHLEKALAMIAATRPAWQGERVCVA